MTFSPFVLKSVIFFRLRLMSISKHQDPNPTECDNLIYKASSELESGNSHQQDNGLRNYDQNSAERRGRSKGNCKRVTPFKPECQSVPSSSSLDLHTPLRRHRNQFQPQGSQS